MDPRHESGARAETAVAEWLRERGFEVLAQNVRVGHLEIDVVARKGPLAVMVEVRTRGKGAYERAFTSIAGIKKMRLLNAADRLWRFKLRNIAGIERLRIDAASVSFAPDGTPCVRYAAGAITAD